MKTLQIVDNAYRATLEEQDDTILWLTQVLRGAGADLALLLTGNAVNYAVAAQQPIGLAIGDWRQAHPPVFPRSLKVLQEKGVEIYAVEEDLRDRGIVEGQVIGDVKPIARSKLAGLIGGFDRVWHW